MIIRPVSTSVIVQSPSNRRTTFPRLKNDLQNDGIVNTALALNLLQAESIRQISKRKVEEFVPEPSGGN